MEPGQFLKGDEKMLSDKEKIRKFRWVFFIAALFTLLAFAPFIITYAAPDDTSEAVSAKNEGEGETAGEPEGEPSGAGLVDLNQNMMDKSYPHDCEITVEFYLEPENTKIGYGDLIALFYQNGRIYRAAVPWRDIEIDTSTMKNSGYVSRSFYIPAGEYEFDFEKQDYFAEYEIFCFQSKVVAKKGEFYRVKALVGTGEWIDENKDSPILIPNLYREMGDTIWDGKSEDAVRKYYEGQTGSMIVADVNGEKALMRFEYYRTYLTFTDEQKKAFVSSLTHGGEVSQDFANFCKKNGIEILISVDEYDGEGNIDKTKIVPEPEPTAVSSEKEVNKLPSSAYIEDTAKDMPKSKFPVAPLVVIGLVAITVFVVIKVIRRR